MVKRNFHTIEPPRRVDDEDSQTKKKIRDCPLFNFNVDV